MKKEQHTIGLRSWLSGYGVDTILNFIKIIKVKTISATMVMKLTGYGVDWLRSWLVTELTIDSFFDIMPKVKGFDSCLCF